MRNLPEILRAEGFRVTATVGLRQDVAEVMDVEPGDTSARNYMVVVDIGTTTVVAHLVDVTTIRTLDAKACFNSQGVYGREVTGRMISAEKRGVEELQRLLMEDLNGLIRSLAEAKPREPAGHQRRGLRRQYGHGALPARASDAQHSAAPPTCRPAWSRPRSGRRGGDPGEP